MKLSFLLIMSLHGKVYAVTGGASGIGLATAKIISERGGTVCIADVDKSSLEKAQSLFKPDGSALIHSATQVDVSKKQDVEAWVQEIKTRFGRLDGAANIAGVTGKDHGIKSVADLDDSEWDKIIGVNLTGTMYCMRAQLRVIEEKGSIVNMASIHATRGKPIQTSILVTTAHPNSLPGMANYAAYAASKHGILGLTRAAAQETGDREIRVNAVAPGPVYTPMMQKYWDSVGRPEDAPFDDPISFRRQASAEEVAQVVLFLLGPESSYVSGSCYAVDGAWT